MNEFNSTTLLAKANNPQPNRLNTLAAADIRQPWRSVYGFPLGAAQLAAGQPLLLHCREDEVFDLLASLNSLLGQTEVLHRAYSLLKRVEEQTRQKLLRRLELEQQPISDSEVSELMASLEQALAQPKLQTTSSRLESILAAPTTGQEAAGLKTMLDRMQSPVSALAAVKDKGFHVVVQDRRRLPARPALEARRAEAVRLAGQPTAIPAGFLLPPRYHLTLWSYLIGRSDRSQSAVWN